MYFFVTIFIVPVATFLFAILWKISQKKKILDWLEQLPKNSEIEIIDVNAYQLMHSEYLQTGYSGTVIGSSVHLSSNYSVTNTTHYAYDFKFKNISANTIAEMKFLCVEYDKKGLINEEERIPFYSQDIRPSETKIISIIENRFPLILDSIALRNSKTNKLDYFSINKPLPRLSYLALPAWFLSLLMAVILFFNIKNSPSWGLSAFIAFACLIITWIGLKKVVTTIPIIIIMAVCLWLNEHLIFTIGSIYLAVVWTRKKDLKDFFQFNWL